MSTSWAPTTLPYRVQPHWCPHSTHSPPGRIFLGHREKCSSPQDSNCFLAQRSAQLRGSEQWQTTFLFIPRSLLRSIQYQHFWGYFMLMSLLQILLWFEKQNIRGGGPCNRLYMESDSIQLPIFKRIFFEEDIWPLNLAFMVNKCRLKGEKRKVWLTFSRGERGWVMKLSKEEVMSDSDLEEPEDKMLRKFSWEKSLIQRHTGEKQHS